MKILLSAIAASLAIGIFLASTVKVNADEYWEQRVSLFDTLPITGNDIVFLGNSITDGGEFAEYFKNPDVKNRGIRSDVIDGVRKRLDQVTDGHPAKIFLLIGINDVSHRLGAARIADKYRTLVREIRSKSPETKLYIQSIMPINNTFKRYKNLIGTEGTIKELNARLRQIALEEGAEYVELTDALSDSKGRLRREFTNDGLHLTGKGYAAWAEVIAPLVGKPRVSIEALKPEKR